MTPLDIRLLQLGETFLEIVRLQRVDVNIDHPGKLEGFLGGEIAGRRGSDGGPRLAFVERRPYFLLVAIKGEASFD